MIRQIRLLVCFLMTSLTVLRCCAQSGVYAAGANGFGQLGTNDYVNSLVFRPVRQIDNTPLPGKVVSVAAGYQHSLALKSDGTVWAWGDGSLGQLGNGSTARSNVPVQVGNLTNVVAIAAGGSHNLALTKDGTVWAWGYNSSGALGNNTKTNSLVPIPVHGYLNNGNLQNIKSIACGSAHSLALATDGTVFAWGNNGEFEVGEGAPEDNTAGTLRAVKLPFKVRGGPMA